ncbi:MAG: hypothetical protein LUD72_03040 [Bacteroidales bacterium]|nr:hypothetical protein [Bacteroidales bacterium]
MNQLSIQKQYPAEKYNLLGNTDVIVEIPEIKKPVVQAVRLSPNPEKGDVYLQQKGYTDKNGKVNPNKYAISKNGLKKLADGAGIKMISSEHVIPTTCQKCATVNQSAGKVVQCGNCNNKDVAFRVTIGVPQLTGEILTVEDTNEIIVNEVTDGMTDKQKKEFLKFLPQICEAKALNGAIRTALHIKGTYTQEELNKPFIVAYLIPNLDHDEVKQAAISNMFQSTNTLFGKAPSVQQIESSVPEDEPAAIEAADGAEIDRYVDGTYTEEDIEEVPVQEPVDETEPLWCDQCGAEVSQKVWDYSIKFFDRPLCYKCQQEARKANNR